ncbi:glycosyltransferase family 2 protein [Cryobacterium sp. M96]|uniref:glycosyltransferase n=1 Tax=Cryobacterium sp. M96 TaxID=2048295 RepID=UPI001E54B287|nr:glycosyltransferase family 2 protein [Cryobacterium sp. M96]
MTVAVAGASGDVYDTAALTEDNELTIALKSLGALIISPSKCTVVTEAMPTVRTLWVQRLRWQRGALENIGACGVSPFTFRYWAQQLGLGYSFIALSAFLLLMLVTLLAIDSWVWFPFGLASVSFSSPHVSCRSGRAVYGHACWRSRFSPS